MVSATRRDFGQLCLILKQNRLFYCGLGGTRTCDLTDVNGAF
jgi:hypothetical protein